VAKKKADAVPRSEAVKKADELLDKFLEELVSKEEKL
jgi:hypothetical protein